VFLPFKKQQHQFQVVNSYINPTLPISFQVGLNLQHCQHPHYGGRGHNCFNRSHPAGLKQTPTNNLEIINVHIACLQHPEDITQKFSKLKRLISVIAYCKRFISNCTNPKSKRQSTFLTSQDLEETLISCVKMVQKFLTHKKGKIKVKSKWLKTAFLSRHCILS